MFDLWLSQRWMSWKTFCKTMNSYLWRASREWKFYQSCQWTKVWRFRCWKQHPKTQTKLRTWWVNVFHRLLFTNTSMLRKVCTFAMTQMRFLSDSSMRDERLVAKEKTSLGPSSKVVEVTEAISRFSVALSSLHSDRGSFVLTCQWSTGVKIWFHAESSAIVK